MTDNKLHRPLTAQEKQELIEGLTQEDTSFRDAIRSLGIGIEDELIYSDLQRAQNRLNHAMLGIHPLYRREVELAGIVDYKDNALQLANGRTIPFEAMDPAYVEFLENQKRIFNVQEQLPLSSVALKASHTILGEDMVVPDISDNMMGVPSDMSSYSLRTLEKAFTNSMVLMTHLNEMIKKHGLDQAYGMNKDHLLQYVGSNSFNNSFEHSVNELSEVAALAVDKYGM